jgi:DNA (cytosine-5)-methyltransferase 1
VRLPGYILPTGFTRNGVNVTSVGAIDLFAGAGGLSLGADLAGAEVRVAVELDPIACRTLRSNDAHRNTTVVEADITTLSGPHLRDLAGLDRTDRLIVIGGPPCQPFSKAAYWLDDGQDARYRQARSRGELQPRPASIRAARPDARRGLVGEIWRIASEANADAFVLENVPSLLHPRHRREIDNVIFAAEAAGYQTCLIRANAAEFGVPQRRVRVFLLAARDGRPLPPDPTHRVGTRALGALPPAVTAGEALAPFLGDDFAEDGEIVEGRWSSHFRTVPPGWNYKFHTAWADHPDPTFLTETRFWNFLLKLDPELPAWTIAANPGPWTGPFHWDNRRLRSVEMAALQGFPANYDFAGNRRERVRQIGNAVPPTLAAIMIRQLLDSIGAAPKASAA